MLYAISLCSWPGLDDGNAHRPAKSLFCIRLYIKSRRFFNLAIQELPAEAMSSDQLWKQTYVNWQAFALKYESR